MQTYAERLASFEVSHPTTKKRTSSAKNAKSLRWPHKTPAPAQLAEAGFVFRPTTSAPDNAFCFLCHMNLDGWEADDDPAVEHLKLSPNCGWAINVCIEKDVEAAISEGESPTSEKMIEARKMTFASAWPHEDKRGWACKTQKMADAGWYYCPTDESDDFVRCAYCNLSLDGWEPKDNPYDEHQRRSEDCVFFSQPATKAKSGRGRKARNSKASRMSTQSNLTAAMENVSIGDTGDSNNRSVMAVEDESIMPVISGKDNKKGTRVKKTAAKPKGKTGKTGVEESMQASSFVEPEDDDFEIKIAPMPAKAIKTTKGKKRKSEELHAYPDVASSVGLEELSPEPPAKRRATRSRASTVHADSTQTAVAHEQDSDLNLTDGESMLPPPVPASKKGGKGGRKRGSSTVRKASATSTASMASLRAAVPDDAEIEAALKADLDRPLTDEESDSAPQLITSSKTRRLTRTKPTLATASIAPTRRMTRTSTVPISSDITHELQADKMADINQVPEHPSQPQSPKGPKSRKVSKKQAAAAAADASQSQPQASVEESEVNVDQNTKNKRAKTRQPSRQIAEPSTRVSSVANASSVEYPSLDLNSSALVSQAAGDDSGHETDASVVNQTKKRGPKKGTKRNKASKKMGMISRKIEDIVQPQPVPEVAVEETHTDAMVIDEPEAAVEQIPEASAPPPAKVTKKKTAKSTKTKASKAKAVVEEPPSPLPMTDEPWTDGILDESTPLPTSMPKNVPTPSPARSVRAQTPLPVSEPAEESPKAPSPQRTPQPIASPQSSDAENQPPSSRPSALRPPLVMQSPSKAQTIRIPLAASTPTASPSKRNNISKLQTSMPWTAVDIEKFFLASPTPTVNKENLAGALIGELTSPEKRMTVEQWIYENARKGEEQLRRDCERLVGKFEGEGVRALKSLEGIRCVE